jgi:hypothetical protein
MAGGAIFWLTSTFGTQRWGLRSVFVCINWGIVVIYLASDYR